MKDDDSIVGIGKIDGRETLVRFLRMVTRQNQ
jgi:hypothetical protein